MFPHGRRRTGNSGAPSGSLVASGGRARLALWLTPAPAMRRRRMEEASLTGASRPEVGWRALLAQACRFLGAGGLATACHYALLAGLVQLGLLGPTPATCAGYATAAALNYWLRRRFVFRSRAPCRATSPWPVRGSASTAA